MTWLLSKSQKTSFMRTKTPKHYESDIEQPCSVYCSVFVLNIFFQFGYVVEFTCTYANGTTEAVGMIPTSWEI